jgi:ABC-type transporter Mla MlaB component
MTTFVVGAKVTRADIPGLCAVLGVLLRDHPADVVIVEVGRLAHPDVASVEALARLGLTARRSGARLTLSGATPDLLRLVRLLGLAEALPAVRGDSPAG